MKYKLYKFVDGLWWIYGTYDDAVNLASAAYELGATGFGIKIERFEGD